MQTEIEFKNIKKSYGGKVVMEGFNLTVEKGDFVTIIGSSGCGKTTALKMVNGLIEPDGGEILIEGKYPQQRPDTASPQHRLCYSGERPVPAYDGRAEYFLCAESDQRTG